MVAQHIQQKLDTTSRWSCGYNYTTSTSSRASKEGKMFTNSPSPPSATSEWAIDDGSPLGLF